MSQFPQLVALMARLRGPDGCPWDRQQTFDSIKPFLLEETYEVVDAIGSRDWDELAGELGDLLLQIVFFAQMAAEEDRFTIEDVIQRIHTKMIRRHPHVFGDARADSAADALRNWEALKVEEKRQRAAERGESYEHPQSVLAGVSSNIPSLMEAHQLSARAGHVGFEWERLEDVFSKLQEEVEELRAEAEESQDESKSSGLSNDSMRRARLESELGDFLFTAVNVARYLGVDAESALRGTNRKFRRRFQMIERELSAAGKSPREATLAEMDSLWNRAKESEKEIKNELGE